MTAESVTVTAHTEMEAHKVQFTKRPLQEMCQKRHKEIQRDIKPDLPEPHLVFSIQRQTAMAPRQFSQWPLVASSQ